MVSNLIGSFQKIHELIGPLKEIAGLSTIDIPSFIYFEERPLQGPPYILARKERYFFSKCVVGNFKIIPVEYMSWYGE